MGTPTNRTPVRIARGSTTALNTGLSDIQEGEIVWDTTLNKLQVKEGSVLEDHAAGAASDPLKANLANPAFTGSLTIDRATTGEDIAKFKSDGSCELYHNNILRLATTNVAVDVSGGLSVSGTAHFGAISNTAITSSSDGAGGYHTMLENSSTGDLYLRGKKFYLQDNTTGNANQPWIHCLPSAGVELSYNGAKAFDTDAQGVSVYANYSVIPGLEGRINFGTSNNCRIEIYGDNINNTAIDNNTFKIYSQHGGGNSTKTSILYDAFFDQVWRTSGSASGPSAELGRVNYDGGWEFYYHNIQGNQGNSWSGSTCIKKLETTADGVEVTGELTSTTTFQPFVAATTTVTAAVNTKYTTDTNSSAFTLTLPASPTVGQYVTLMDIKGTWATNNLTVAQNGNNIQGAAADLVCNVNHAHVTLIYTADATTGWVVT